jgi:glucose 1-dehydrogenase
MVKRLRTIEILVNNAGLQRDSPFQDITLAQWNMMISVNLTGQFLCARAAIVEFLRRGVHPEVSSSAGKIICMSFVHQEIPWAGHCIAPGAIRTPINAAAWKAKEAYDALMRLVPYRRIKEPDDIAKPAVRLASDRADYVVGATLFVDGGMTLFPGFSTGG